MQRASRPRVSTTGLHSSLRGSPNPAVYKFTTFYSSIALFYTTWIDPWKYIYGLCVDILRHPTPVDRTLPSSIFTLAHAPLPRLLHAFTSGFLFALAAITLRSRASPFLTANRVDEERSGVEAAGDQDETEAILIVDRGGRGDMGGGRPGRVLLGLWDPFGGSKLCNIIYIWARAFKRPEPSTIEAHAGDTRILRWLEHLDARQDHPSLDCISPTSEGGWFAGILQTEAKTLHFSH
eukprot:765980-Hanusia_phi.AAC.1